MITASGVPIAICIVPARSAALIFSALSRMLLVVSSPSAFRNPRCWATQNGRLNKVRETLATLTISLAGAGAGINKVASAIAANWTVGLMGYPPAVCSGHGSVAGARSQAKVRVWLGGNAQPAIVSCWLD